MLYTTRQWVPRMLNGTERSAFSPLNDVTFRQRGDSATESVTVDPGAIACLAAGSCCRTVPAATPGAGTRLILVRRPRLSSTAWALSADSPTTFGTGTGGG